MQQWWANLLGAHPDDEETQRLGSMVAFIASGLTVTAALFVVVILVIPDSPKVTLFSAVCGIFLFLFNVVMARRGYAMLSGILLVIQLILLPLATMITVSQVDIVPFLLVLSVIVAGLILRPWHVWVVMLTDIVGLATVAAILPARDVVDPSGQISLLGGSIMLFIVATVSYMGARVIETSLQTARHSRVEAEATAAALVRINRDMQAEIVERKRAVEALVDAKEAAEAANRAKSAFLGNVSHELRTPLTAMLGYNQLMRLQVAQGDYDQLSSDINRIETAGNHLLNLINDLLDITRIEAGKAQLNLEAFAVASLIDSVVASVRPLIEQNENVLNVVCPDTLVQIYADKTKVRQVLLNLLSNAAKFTSHGQITLQVQHTPHYQHDSGRHNGREDRVHSDTSRWIVFGSVIPVLV